MATISSKTFLEQLCAALSKIYSGRTVYVTEITDYSRRVQVRVDNYLFEFSLSGIMDSFADPLTMILERLVPEFNRMIEKDTNKAIVNIDANSPTAKEDLKKALRDFGKGRLSIVELARITGIKQSPDEMLNEIEAEKARGITTVSRPVGDFDDMIETGVVPTSRRSYITGQSGTIQPSYQGYVEEETPTKPLNRNLQSKISEAKTIKKKREVVGRHDLPDVRRKIKL